MAVVVAERGGLHAAATRYACAGPLSPTASRARGSALAIESAMLAACTVGASYGDVLEACDDAYAAAGHPGAWREHYQGGPIAYRQREFETAPRRRDAPVRRGAAIAPGHALAWNPSVAGGGKAEDTYLVGTDGLERLTDTADWPLLADGRPAALDVRDGTAGPHEGLRVARSASSCRSRHDRAHAARASPTAPTSASRSRASRARACSTR